ncbi:MAG TPA: hypothetical protein VNH11_36120 [Pirellulales bacterium]|nr:hypothetical protein [Pirellulales bacterium]
MGVHFTVTADHDLRDTSLDAVRGCFTPLEPLFLEISTRRQAGPDRWQNVTEPGNAQPNHFYAPAGFSVFIGPAALTFHHGTRFEMFIEAASERELLRRFSRHLASLFGQQRALYAPCEGAGDVIRDLVIDGCSLAEIEARLHERSSPPTTIEELADRSWPELRYYFDEFDGC